MYQGIRAGNAFVQGTDQAIIDDFNRFDRMAKGSKDEVLTNLIDFMGLGAENKYGVLSRVAKVGLETKQALDAETARVGARATTSFVGEMNLSADAQQLSENILKSYISMLEEKSDDLNILTKNDDELSEFFKTKKSRTLMEINDKVYAMIYKAAEINEGVTVGQLADNMEFMMNSRYPRLRALMTAQIFGEKVNNIGEMFFGAQQSRRLRNAQRQGRSLDLVGSYNSMVDSMKADSATKKTILDQMIENHERFKRISVASTLSDESITAAAAIYEFSEKKDYSMLELSQENERLVRDLIADSQAKRFIDESGIDELLSFGRSPAQGLAPSNIDDILDPEQIRSITLGQQIGDDQGVVNPSTYRRITDNWKDSKLYEAFGDPIVKRSSYALVGLIAASLLYSGARDRSQDDMSGPPLLPGGSSYEQMAQRQANLPDVSMFSSYNQGTSYSVNLEGSQDQIDSFSAVAGGNGSSTIYRGIPQLGRDPYPTLAGSF
jgi:hypothetical protein